MSEMEELKRNAEREYVRQRHEEVQKYLDTLMDEIDNTLYWSLRGDKLFFFAFLMYFVLFGVSAWLDTPKEVTDIAYELHVIVVWVSIFRSWFLYRDMSVASSEFRGAITMLRKLGMLKGDLDEGETRKQKVKEPMFARIKTMLEKTFERESKEAMQPV